MSYSDGPNRFICHRTRVLHLGISPCETQGFLRRANPAVERNLEFILLRTEEFLQSRFNFFFVCILYLWRSMDKFEEQQGGLTGLGVTEGLSIFIIQTRQKVKPHSLMVDVSIR